MGWEAFATAGIVVGMLALLVTGRFGADIVIMGALTALLVLGILEPVQAVSGFANPAVITVGLLYVVAAGLKETGAIALISSRVLGRPKTERSALVRLCIPTAFFSAFANNTPIVATYLPMVASFCKRSGIPAGKLMMPLSFATILGGLCTLIGTSTTLVVAGLLDQRHAEMASSGVTGEALASVAPTFSMFTLTPIGLPVAIIGIGYIIVFSRRLLPKTGDALADYANTREYTTSLRVTQDSPVVGRTIEQAGLRHLPGAFLSRIERGEETLVAVSHEQKIQAGDVLVFVGALESVVDLQSTKGLIPTGVEKEQAGGYRPSLRLIEAVVSPASPLVNTTIREAGIRARYDAVVVAVHRQGQAIEGKIGDIRLRAGDTLLLEAGPDFLAKHRDSKDFYLVNELADAPSPRHEKAYLAIGVLVLFVVLISLGIPGIVGAWKPMTAAMLAAGLMVVLRCCTGPQARRAVDFQVLAVIGGAFGIGQAMTSTGLAPAIADALVTFAKPIGPVALLAVLYLCTVLFTTFITNNAAAVLMFPIAMDAAEYAGIPVIAAAVVVAIAASAEFSTPIGYQTNLMVAGPGGYRWSHYLRFGLPLTLICAAVAVTAVAIILGVSAAGA